MILVKLFNHDHLASCYIALAVIMWSALTPGCHRCRVRM